MRAGCNARSVCRDFRRQCARRGRGVCGIRGNEYISIQIEHGAVNYRRIANRRAGGKLCRTRPENAPLERRRNGGRRTQRTGRRRERDRGFFDRIRNALFGRDSDRRAAEKPRAGGRAVRVADRNGRVRPRSDVVRSRRREISENQRKRYTGHCRLFRKDGARIWMPPPWSKRQTRITATRCSYRRARRLRKRVAFFQARFKAVWLAADSAEEFNFYRCVSSGAYGILSDGEPETLYHYYDNYNINSIPRAYLNIAHRGMPYGYPENTLEGCIAAYEAGRGRRGDRYEGFQRRRNFHTARFHARAHDRRTGDRGTYDAGTVASI